MPDNKGWIVGRQAIEVLEAPGGDLACFFWGLEEIGVGKEIVRLSLYRNKANPELLYESKRPEIWFLYHSTAQFGSGGLVFLHLFGEYFFSRRLKVRLCIFDINSRRLKPLKLPDHFYQVRHIQGMMYGLTPMTYPEQTPAKEQIVDLKQLL